MTLPGLLIEYLITGAICMGWIIFGFHLEDNLDTINQLILIPVAYVLGMLIDIVTYALTFQPKWMIRKFAEKRFYKSRSGNFNHQDRNRLNALLVMKHDKLNEEIKMRSSRDRIARGMIVNIIALLILVPDLITLKISIPLLATSIVSWIFFEYVSHRFYLGACDVVKDESEM